MATGATGQLGLALPVQGELSGTWGDTVNNGITQYTNIAIAATLTLTNDGAVTLANTTGDASASNIVSSLTGAGTVTAQFAIVRVTGTLTTAKVVTAPSYSKTYTVVNAATGGIVTFKASGQTGVSIAVGESAFVYYNGTDYVKVSSTVATGVTSFSAGTTGFTPNTATTGAVTLAGTLATTNGGTGLTSFTSGGVVYASSTSALATGSTLTFSSNIFKVTNASGYSTTTLSGSSGTGGILSFVDSASVTTQRIVGFGSTAGENTSLRFDTNGAERMRIDGSGSIGIGSTATNPAGYSIGVNLNGASNVGYQVSVAGTLVGAFSGYAGETRISSQSTNPMTFHINASEQMRLTSTGNLGLGTSSPAEKLTLYSATSLGIRMDSPDNIIRFMEGATAKGYIRMIGGATNRLDILNNGNGMYVDSSGNVGIGTSSPGALLHLSAAQAFQYVTSTTGTNSVYARYQNTGGQAFFGLNNSTATDFGNSAYSLNVYHSGAYPIVFSTSATERMRLDNAGNLGLGVTPSAWDTAIFRTVQIGSGVGSVSLSGRTDNGKDMVLGSNLYYGTSSFRYVGTGTSTMYRMDGATHSWQIAASGTAGNAISFTQAMTLDASGNLIVGGTSALYGASGRGVITINGSSAALLGFTVAGADKGFVYHDGNNLLVSNTVSASLLFQTNNTERARIDSVGNVLIGGTAARGTTVGTKHLDLFDGTAPAGTLTNGVSLYSSSGDLKFMNAAGDAFDVGYRNIPQNAQTGNYTLTLADSGDHIYHAVGAGAATYTIPANSSVAFPIGTAVTFINMSTTSISIAITTDTMYLSSAGTTGTRTLAQYGSATAIKLTSTTWLISGSGLT